MARSDVRITTRAVEALRKQAIATASDLFLWDKDSRGFGAKATKSGGVSWLVQKSIGGRGGKRQRVVIGHYPTDSVDDARKIADGHIGDASRGVDLPNRKREKRMAKREAYHAIKLREAADKYLERRSQPGRYWSEVTSRFNGEIIPSLGADTRVVEIGRREVRALIDTKLDAGHPVAARNLFAVLRPFFKWCIDREIITVSPLDGVNGPKPPEARDRVLADHEIKAVWFASQYLPVFGPFYRLLMLTGQRRNEVAGIDRKELDLDAGLWTIPPQRTKNGKEHLVHLSPLAVTIIKGIDAVDGTSLLFPVKGKKGKHTPISAYSDAKAELDAAMMLKLEELGKPFAPWRVHDLRRTAASGMGMLGFPPHVVERVLNHLSGAQGGLVGVYQKYEYLEDRKRAIHSWGNYVDGLHTTRPSNVTPLFSNHTA